MIVAVRKKVGLCIFKKNILANGKSSVPAVMPEPGDLIFSRILANPRANGAKRRSGRKPGARVTNLALP